MSTLLPFDDTVQLAELPSDPFADTTAMGDREEILPPDEGEGVTEAPVSAEADDISRKRGYLTVAVLLMINLLNYMDRFTVAGVLDKIQKAYNVSKVELGLLQTSFILTYMILSPIFGFLGDRWIRKYIMAAGILFWSAVTLTGSFMTNFWAFLFMRALVGIGEASYSTIAPTLIADLFAKDKRTLMLMFFYFAIPVGSGMGYILSSNIAKWTGHWQWALRVTPIFGAISVVLILVLVKEPQRGQAEGGTHITHTSWWTDIKALLHNKSFILSSFGFTCVAFVTGALAFWAPYFMMYAIGVQSGRIGDEAQVGLVFGVITCAAGFVGVAMGTESARRLKKHNPRADPLVCAFGMLTCTPFLYFAIVVSQYNEAATWVLIFLGETMLCLNWAIVADMLLYVVLPTRRSTAESFQILMSHALGDAGSPYLVGQIASSLSWHYTDKWEVMSQFITLQYALFITTFVCVLGGACFLATALFIDKDRARVDAAVRDAMQEEKNQEHLSKGDNLSGEEFSATNGNAFANSAQLANPVA